ncbi:hypothetical protein AK812_SmicGene27103 [Symbiodinium microadriaticum]|uniref:Uncharacterized protein n=1 Tax=Symbiodinium microadriaticum TaxID=2951 RepID=A0A1Q9D7Q8_SYMMI|nr:hypothetical protein AK812_SmicGene27103 [Symbiodinium microadriaticum]
MPSFFSDDSGQEDAFTLGSPSSPLADATVHEQATIDLDLDVDPDLVQHPVLRRGLDTLIPTIDDQNGSLTLTSPDLSKVFGELPLVHFTRRLPFSSPTPAAVEDAARHRARLPCPRTVCDHSPAAGTEQLWQMMQHPESELQRSGRRHSFVAHPWQDGAAKQAISLPPKWLAAFSSRDAIGLDADRLDLRLLSAGDRLDVSTSTSTLAVPPSWQVVSRLSGPTLIKNATWCQQDSVRVECPDQLAEGAASSTIIYSANGILLFIDELLKHAIALDAKAVAIAIVVVQDLETLVMMQVECKKRGPGTKFIVPDVSFSKASWLRTGIYAMGETPTDEMLAILQKPAIHREHVATRRWKEDPTKIPEIPGEDHAELAVVVVAKKTRNRQLKQKELLRRSQGSAILASVPLDLCEVPRDAHAAMQPFFLQIFAGYQLKSCAMAPLFALDCEPIPGLTYQLRGRQSTAAAHIDLYKALAAAVDSPDTSLAVAAMRQGEGWFALCCVSLPACAATANDLLLQLQAAFDSFAEVESEAGVEVQLVEMICHFAGVVGSPSKFEQQSEAEGESQTLRYVAAGNLSLEPNSVAGLGVSLIQDKQNRPESLCTEGLVNGLHCVQGDHSAVRGFQRLHCSTVGRQRAGAISELQRLAALAKFQAHRNTNISTISKQCIQPWTIGEVVFDGTCAVAMAETCAVAVPVTWIL